MLTDILTSHLNFNGKTLSVTKRLTKADYAKVKGLFNQLGGKWNTEHQSFTFNRDPKALIERVLQCGSRYLNKFHLYPSTEDVFNHMERWTSLSYLGASGSNVEVLEPSIGTGSLASSLMQYGKREGRKFTITGYDIDPINVICCQEQGFDVTEGNFLSVTPEPKYSLVLMNPPFNGNEFIKHIRHALRFLSPSGRLISVIPTHWLADINTPDRMWLLERILVDNSNALIEGDFLPPGTFNGTKVTTTIIELNADSEHGKSVVADNTYKEKEATLFNIVFNNPELNGELLSLDYSGTDNFSSFLEKVYLEDDAIHLPRSMEHLFVESLRNYIASFAQSSDLAPVDTVSMWDLLFMGEKQIPANL